MASLSARWGGRRLPCLTGRFRCDGKTEKTVVSESSCAIRVHRGEREETSYSVWPSLRNEKRDWAFWNGMGMAPRRGFEPRRTVPKTGVLPLHQRGIGGVLAESPTRSKGPRLVRHRSRTQWHVRDRMRAALTRPALPSVDSNHDAGIQNPACCRLHQRGRVCALTGSWTGLRNKPVSPAIVPAIRHMTNGSGRR